MLDSKITSGSCFSFASFSSDSNRAFEYSFGFTGAGMNVSFFSAWNLPPSRRNGGDCWDRRYDCYGSYGSYCSYGSYGSYVSAESFTHRHRCYQRYGTLRLGLA